MGSRLALHEILKTVLGSTYVYFQPPENISLVYPCIIYSRTADIPLYANDTPYYHCLGYTVTVIDKNPDSIIPSKVAALPMCKFQRNYTANNLNHDVYNIYY